jgi:23S rRNA (adenine2503-C2)-methyltransferase
MDAAKVLARQAARYGAQKRAFLGMTMGELREAVEERGMQSFRAQQIRDAVKKGARELSDLRLLPLSARAALTDDFCVGRSVVDRAVQSVDGTKKFLLRLHDGLVIETVGIPTEDRLTVCVSSQVGCPLKCTFCATGKGGYARNLMPHEICEQVLTVGEAFSRRVSHVVFMGMGEPLLNMQSVLRAHLLLTSHDWWEISARNITISTVGVRGAIPALAEHRLASTLAISLHAPNQELRQKLVPSAAAYPLQELLGDACNYFAKTKRRISFEYVLLGNVNDQPQHASELAKLLNCDAMLRSSHVNLIAWNSVADAEFETPAPERVRLFMEILQREGIQATLREPRGLDVNAACGMLRNAFQSRDKQQKSTLHQ